MATITRTETIESNITQITRETIANLLENAVVGSVGYSDLATDALMVVSQSEAPDLVAGRFWWDMTDKLMRVWDNAHSLWISVGPDRREVPVIHGDDAYAVIPKGAWVALNTEDSGYVDDGAVRVGAVFQHIGAFRHFCGVLQDTLASGGLHGRMAVAGFCEFLHDDAANVIADSGFRGSATNRWEWENDSTSAGICGYIFGPELTTPSLPALVTGLFTGTIRTTQ
jgi:hypothetical protein